MYRSRGGAQPAPPPTGVSSAARVSFGSKHDTWGGLTGHGRSPVRHESERITVTIVLYNIVTGGVPSEADVAAAVEDLERLYAACRADERKQTPVFNATWPTPSAPLAPPAPSNPFATPMPAPQPPAVSDSSTFPLPTPPALPAGALPFTPFVDVPTAINPVLAKLPISLEGYHHVFGIALAKLQPPTASRAQLAESHALFRVAIEMHAQIDGAPPAEALYNLACTLSRLADAPQPNAFAAAPTPGSAYGFSREQCLNASVGWLRAAAAAGYKEHAHMRSDPDLAAVRKARPKFCETAYKIAEATAGGM